MTNEDSKQESLIRLIRVESAMEHLAHQFSNVASEMKRIGALAESIAAIQEKHNNVERELASQGTRITSVSEELNNRINRAKTLIGDVDTKHQNTTGRIWFWQGAVWGAGLLIAVVLGLVTYIGSKALDKIDEIERRQHQIEIDHYKGGLPR